MKNSNFCMRSLFVLLSLLTLFLRNNASAEEKMCPCPEATPFYKACIYQWNLICDDGCAYNNMCDAVSAGQKRSHCRRAKTIRNIFLRITNIITRQTRNPILMEVENLYDADTTHFDLFGKALTGSIPGELGRYTALTHLDLSVNSLTGTIPRELAQCTALNYFQSYANELTGTIPKEVGLFTSLQILDLSYNKIGGTIPTEIGLCTSLVSLNLAYNALTGTIPTELARCTKLKFLTLNLNLLPDITPPELDFINSINFVAEELP